MVEKGKKKTGQSPLPSSATSPGLGMSRLPWTRRSNIRVNAVCPGIIDTPMRLRVFGDTPEERARVLVQEPIGWMSTLEEIAVAVIWLCSDAAAFVTGHALVIDGGQTPWRPQGSLSLAAVVSFPWQFCLLIVIDEVALRQKNAACLMLRLVSARPPAAFCRIGQLLTKNILSPCLRTSL
jgi:hypothetical protein